MIPWSLAKAHKAQTVESLRDDKTSGNRRVFLFLVFFFFDTVLSPFLKEIKLSKYLDRL